MVGKVKDIAGFCPFVSASYVGIGHKRRDAIKLFNECIVITSSDNALFVHIYNIVAHHLAGTNFPEWSKDLANKVNIFSCTGHSAKLRSFNGISKKYFKVVVAEDIASNVLFLRCRDVEELRDAVAEAHGGGGFDD